MRFRVLSLVGALVVCAALSAQESEQRDMTEQRLIDDRSAALASPTPFAGPSTPGNVNYLDRFIAALQSFSDSGGEALTLDYNVPDGIFGKSLSSKVQLAAKKPELNAKYLTALGSNTARITLLQNELSLGDDLTFSFSISPQAQKKAEAVRDALSAYQGEVVKSKISARRRTNELVVTEDGRASQSPSILSIAAVDAVSPRILEANSDFELLDAMLRGDVSLQDVSLTGNIDASASEERAVVALRDRAARVAAAALADEIAQETGNVAAQQSKFNFNASYRNRGETAGPDEWFVKTSYEHGFGANIAKRVNQIAERNRKRGCAQAYLAPQRGAGCAPEVAEALREAADSTPVQTGSRLTFALEYHNYSTVDIALDNFKLPGSKSLVASLNYGRDVFASKEAKDRSGRIELVAAYDDVSGDKDRKNRMIGTLTYSQRINEDFYIPVSLVYANHADYLSNVDRKFNAHFGIAYKLQNKPKPKAN